MSSGRHRRPPGRIARAVTFSGAAGVIAIAAFVAAQRPDDLTSQRSFAARGGIGTLVDGRDFQATVNKVIVADEIRVGGQELATTGRWIVADVTVGVETDPSSVGTARLVIGERTYTSTQRLSQDDLSTTHIQPGLPRRGLVAFEVPEAAAAAIADLGLARSGDPRLDSMLTVTVDLGEAETTDVVEITAPTYAELTRA